MAEHRYAFAVDTVRCVGCHTCAVACKQENNVPDGVLWNRVVTEGANSLDASVGEYPNVTKSYLTVACQHCENPACTKVCPVGATYKDPETGAVCQDCDKCIGCRMCVAACPYTGVRSFNWDEPAYSIPHAVGDASVATHLKHTVEKCTMCSHRLKDGKRPFCVDACPTYARFWGDLDDPESEVSRLLATREYKQLLPEEGTKPSVYYLV